MNDQMIKFSIWIERIWFAFIFIFLGLSIWKYVELGWPKAAMYFVFPVVALVMFFLRRRQRIKMQNMQKDRKKDIEKEG